MIVGKTKDVQSYSFKELEKFGNYHVCQYVLICLPIFMVAMTHVNYIFVAENVNHRCRVPECESSYPTTDTPPWWPSGVDPKCFKPVVNEKKMALQNYTCSISSFLDVLEECHEWIYEHNNSIVSELNLGCQSWKATLVGSIHNAGMIVATLFMGWISDRVGRQPAIIICSVGGFIGMLKIFIKNYYAYLTVEFLESLIASGLYIVAVVLLIEVGGETKRVTASVVFSYAIYIGEIAFAFIAMGLQYWKYLIIIVYAPMVLFVSYGFVLKESTRWQILNGRIDCVKNTFKVIAKMNKIDISHKEIEEKSEEEIRKTFAVEVQKEKENIKDIIRSKEIMTRLAVTSFCFFTSSFIYYGLMVHAVFLPGNKYTNFVLASVTAFPGDMLALFVFNKYGRRISLQCGYVASALFLIAQAYSPDSIAWVKVMLFLFGKIGVVICFTGIFTYSLELFPTSVRGSLVGCGNTAARVGSMLAPLTPLLTSQMVTLPSILFASTSAVAAMLLLFTPETKTLPLFDTIAQIEAYNAKMTTYL